MIRGAGRYSTLITPQPGHSSTLSSNLGLTAQASWGSDPSLKTCSSDEWSQVGEDFASLQSVSFR